jgi:hypothetical protein
MNGPLKERLMEADAQHEQRGRVWDTLRRIVTELERLGVDYAVAGGIALQHHGILRSTQDVDLLIGSPAGLERVHQALVGRGYQRKSPTSRHLRDEITRVRIKFLVAGDYPGDGKPKPVRFPEPSVASERGEEGIRFLTLRDLIELKLASARSAPQRIKDRADVLELIHAHGLSASFVQRLDPYVRDEFVALTALPPPTEPD